MLKYQVRRHKLTLVYTRNGQGHQCNGPAFISHNGFREWREYGKLHRIDNYAKIYSNGDTEYWIRGEQ